MKKRQKQNAKIFLKISKGQKYFKMSKRQNAKNFFLKIGRTPGTLKKCQNNTSI